MLKKSLLAAALFVGAIATSPANADLVPMGSSQGWRFSANLDTGLCMAGTVYQNGDTVILALNHDGFSMSFRSTKSKRLNIGTSYHIDVSSGKSSGRLWGTAVDRDQIVIHGLTANTVIRLAKERRLVIKDFGSYSLHGSYNAVKSLTECFSAIR